MNDLYIDLIRLILYELDGEFRQICSWISTKWYIAFKGKYRKYSNNKIIFYASGVSLPLLNYCIRNSFSLLNSDLIRDIGINAEFEYKYDIINSLMYQYKPLPYISIKRIVRNDEYDSFIYITKYMKFTKRTLEVIIADAIIYNSRRILGYYYNKRISGLIYVNINNLFKNGCLHGIKFLLNRINLDITQERIDIAKQNNHNELVEYLIDIQKKQSIHLMQKIS